MTTGKEDEAPARALFLPSRRAWILFAALGLASLGTALFLRYGIIQNTPIGLACEAGEGSLTCKVRLTVILMFIQDTFGWIAMIAAGVQLWRPNRVAFAVGLVAALLGLVLYNTRASALAMALLMLSLARPAPEGR
ncbi:MAG TPA: hypothetical protein VGN85_03665 [Methyloceanibacter sp.]|jgi:hypothetical protein|nr:hypothetical protein [Methyloceanibacter sp.]